MKTCVAGIVAEYNPFHNGHTRLIEAARAAGATHVAAVMSGNFIQRGGPAAMPKFIRAEAAVASGVDLVIELPLPYAMATAKRFAHGAVYLLGALGCVDMLAFGSERGSVEPLRRAAETLRSPECSARTKHGLEGGVTYAAARQKALAELAGYEAAALLETPNNTLAIEYLTALSHYGYAMEPFTIRREGAPHDSDVAETGSATASLLRRLMAEKGIQAAASYVPQAAFRRYLEGEGRGLLPCREQRLETAVLAMLRAMDRESLADLPDLSEGLEDRLYKSVRHSVALPGLLEAVKTKRYPLSRIRRIVWSAFLGIPAKMGQTPPPYLRILALNRRGKEILSMASPSIPMSASMRDLERLGGGCARLVKLEARAADLYALALPAPQPCGLDYTHRVIPISEPASAAGSGARPV